MTYNKKTTTMAVIYRGEKPTQNYPLSAFLEKAIDLSWCIRFRNYKNEPQFRAIFRSNGLLGEIRSCGKTWAVDVRWGWSSDQQSCLTTECKNIREAKSILFLWFKSKGFVVPKSITDTDWRKGYLSYQNVQLSIFKNINSSIFARKPA